MIVSPTTSPPLHQTPKHKCVYKFVNILHININTAYGNGVLIGFGGIVSKLRECNWRGSLLCICSSQSHSSLAQYIQKYWLIDDNHGKMYIITACFPYTALNIHCLNTSLCKINTNIAFRYILSRVIEQGWSVNLYCILLDDESHISIDGCYSFE